MSEILCNACGKLISFDDEKPAFCSKCGSKLTDGGPGPEELLRKASAESDPVKKHDILLEAKQQFPDSPEVERQLLYLGRMWERGGKPDFYRIPFWPLSVFETPKLYSGKQREEMVDRFFDNPELARVADLMPDRTAFLDEYMEYMAQEYVKLFIKSSSTNSTFLGFRRKPDDVMKRSAGCVCTILKNIEKNDMLDTSVKMRLQWAFVRSFGTVFESENGADYLKSILK